MISGFPLHNRNHSHSSQVEEDGGILSAIQVVASVNLNVKITAGSFRDKEPKKEEQRRLMKYSRDGKMNPKKSSSYLVPVILHRFSGRRKWTSFSAGH